MTITSLEGFDPLSDKDIDQSTLSKLVPESQKRDVLNILRSYTGTLDLFSEAIQNALDACQSRFIAQSKDYIPFIKITIDMSSSNVKIVDNGVGMSAEEARFFLRPGMSFKSGKGLRGQKGVGATFLAYGYSSFAIYSKQADSQISATLTGGRQWAESTTNNIPRPRFADIPFAVQDLEGCDSGTCIEVTIGDHRDERPNLNWLNITEASVWLKVLRLRTPLGGVYIKTPKFKVKFTISIIDAVGNVSKVEPSDEEAEFYFPHTFQVCQRQADTTEIQKSVKDNKLTRKDIPQLLPMKFRNLDCLWNIWNEENLLDEDGPFREDFQDEQKSLLIKHKVHVYGCFVRSRTIWETFQKDELSIRPQFRVIQGGLQLASDYMVQGDLVTIPLTTAAGYQANSFIVVHFTNGNPDMGRKVFQPELKELADIISRRVVAELRKYQACLKADTGAQSFSPSKDLEDWKDSQKDWAKSHPLRLVFPSGEVMLVSEPREEQDVIALFHQLVGMNVIRGLRFYGTGYNTRYDGLYYFKYDDSHRFSSDQNFWGVDARVAPSESAAQVLEYKYSVDSLVRDFDKEEKSSKEINLVVCWEIGSDYKKNFDIISYMIGQEGGAREHFAATHALFVGSGRTTKLFEIVCLRDFIEYSENPATACAKQAATYG